MFGVVMAVAMMAAIAYSAEIAGWTLKRGAIIAAVSVGVLIFGQNRRAILGGAFAIVAFRSIFGLLQAGDQVLVFIAITASAGIAAWLLLRNL